MNLGLRDARAFISATPPTLNNAIAQSLEEEGARTITGVVDRSDLAPAWRARPAAAQSSSITSPAPLERGGSVDRLDLVVIGGMLSPVGHLLERSEQWLHDLRVSDCNPILAWRWAERFLSESERSSLLVHLVSVDPRQVRLEDHPTVAIVTEAIRRLTVLAAPVRFNALVCRPRHAVAKEDLIPHEECAKLAVFLLSPASVGVSGLMVEVRVGSATADGPRYDRDDLYER